MANKINLDKSLRLDITCRKGDTFQMNITIQNANNERQSITSDRFSMQVRRKDTDEGANGLILTTDSNQASIDGGSNNPTLPNAEAAASDAFATFTIDRGSSNSTDSTYGVLTITVSALDMSNVPAGRYVYDIEHYSSTNELQRTLLNGNFVVNEDVSNVGAIS